jgi:adenosine tuberculosinyltransferase
MISLDSFLKIPNSDVEDIIHEYGPQVCVFPLNGTRRWFLLEKQPDPNKNQADSLVTSTGYALQRVVGLLFDHGLDTVLTPVYGKDLVAERGSQYHKLAKQGLWLLTEASFQAFYDAQGIRVRFYGEYETVFADDPTLLETLLKTEQRTAHHTDHRLFYGVCGESAVRTITARAVELGREISHQEAIEAFYGESVKLADLFIGFDAPTAFDMPLLDSGGVDLYFTLSPSPYVDQIVIRTILYDWIFIRSDTKTDYSDLTTSDWTYMREYYQHHRREVVGMGLRRNGIWYIADRHPISKKVKVKDDR